MSETRTIASLESEGPDAYALRPPISMTLPTPELEQRIGGFAQH